VTLAGLRVTADNRRIDKVKGAVKDTAGKVTGDKKMQAEGKMDKAKGAAHAAVGDAKDTARDATR
jgi:uncharacterized protein YjbJ (UPF0337 family)